MQDPGGSPQRADAPTIGLVVPLYDERERIPDYLDDIFTFMKRWPDGSELIFVDDGSTDDTVDVLESRLAAAEVDATVLRRVHRGKGAALSSGIRRCGADVIAFCDLDLATPLDDLARIIELASNSDVLAIGSRDVLGSVVVKPEDRLRRTLGRVYNRLLQALVTPGVVDTQCGAKAAPAAVWNHLLDHCEQEGFAWDAELVAVAIATHVPVHEVPIVWRHDDRTHVRLARDGMAMVAQTPRLRRSARRASAAVSSPGVRAPGAPEVFDDVNADLMLAVDRSHWWFRSKAAFLATSLRRTAGGEGSVGILADVGGGSGAVSSMLGWPLEKIVVVEGNAELARSAHESGVASVRGSICDLPFEDGTVSVLILADVIEHLDEPVDALIEAARVLRSDGRVLVNVPAHEWLWSSTDEFLGHRRRYSRRKLRAQMEAAGLRPEIITHVFGWLVPPVLVVRRVKSAASGPELGLDRRSTPIDLMSLILTRLECTLIGRIPTPLGTSMLSVARPDRAAEPRSRRGR